MLVLGYGTHHLCQLGCAIDCTTGRVDIKQDGMCRRICCGLQQSSGSFLHAAQPHPANGSNSFLTGRYLTQHRSMNANGGQSLLYFVRLSLFVNSVTLRRGLKVHGAEFAVGFQRYQPGLHGSGNHGVVWVKD